jgi:hypothetical protein
MATASSPPRADDTLVIHFSRSFAVAMMAFGGIYFLISCVILLGFWQGWHLPSGTRMFGGKSAVVGLAGVFLGPAMLFAGLQASRGNRRLLIARDSFRELCGERIVVHIPFRNVAEVYLGTYGQGQVLAFNFHDVNDPETRYPREAHAASRARNGYDFGHSVAGYERDPAAVLGAIRESLRRYQAGG